MSLIDFALGDIYLGMAIDLIVIRGEEHLLAHGLWPFYFISQEIIVPRWP
jgi:hypothetical protein